MAESSSMKHQEPEYAKRFENYVEKMENRRERKLREFLIFRSEMLVMVVMARVLVFILHVYDAENKIRPSLNMISELLNQLQKMNNDTSWP